MKLSLAERFGAWFSCAAILVAVAVFVGNGVRWALGRVGAQIEMEEK